MAVGLMSGTSIDGIDAAIMTIEGFGEATKVELLEFETFAYSEEEKAAIRNLCSPVTASIDRICTMNVYLGRKFAEAVLGIMGRAGLSPKTVDFISSHGQTIYHMPETGSTLQIGELAVIAEETGCLTIGDFRPSDMAVGGQGAPLVPFTDALLFRSKERGRILLNIGGMSNITILPKDGGLEDVYGFDTGPGNVLIDEIVRLGSGGRQTFDAAGAIAMSGKVHEVLLERLVACDPFIMLPPPKSTGRELYTIEMAKTIWEEGCSLGLSFADIVATVTGYTVEAIRLNLERLVLPKTPIDEIIVSGGGAHNRALMGGLARAGFYKVMKMEDLCFSSDAKEAIAFAVLGNEFLHGQPNHLPRVTGAKRSTIMGKMVFPGSLKF